MRFVKLKYSILLQDQRALLLEELSNSTPSCLSTWHWKLVGKPSSRKQEVSPPLSDVHITKKVDKAPWICGSVLFMHKKEAHQDELSQLKDAVLEKSELFVCRQCEYYMVNSKGKLKAHIAKCHVGKCKDTNHTLLSEFMYSSVSHASKNYWTSCLSFLRNLHLSESTFR